MPYITKDRRRLVGLCGEPPQNCGELNYMFSMAVLESDDMRGLQSELGALCHQYIINKGLKYQHINDVVGAIFGAKAEMVRRTGRHKFDSLFDDVARSFYAAVAAPYEDTKIAENGDLPYPEPQWPARDALPPRRPNTGRLPPMQEQVKIYEGVRPSVAVENALRTGRPNTGRLPPDRTDPEGGIPGRG